MKKFKLNNSEKLNFVMEFTMKMRDAKVIYALRKVVEREFKVPFKEYLEEHTKSVDTISEMFGDAKKFLTYKRNAELVKIPFDVEKIDASWHRFVNKVVTQETEIEVKHDEPKDEPKKAKKSVKVEVVKDEPKDEPKKESKTKKKSVKVEVVKDEPKVTEKPQKESNTKKKSVKVEVVKDEPKVTEKPQKEPKKAKKSVKVEVAKDEPKVEAKEEPKKAKKSKAKKDTLLN